MSQLKCLYMHKIICTGIFLLTNSLLFGQLHYSKFLYETCEKQPVKSSVVKKIDHIELISFGDRKWGIAEADTIMVEGKMQIGINTHKSWPGMALIDSKNYDTTFVIESKKIDNVPKEIRQIFKTQGDTTGPISEMMCYMPRNAMVFYNKKNEIIDCIEICFQCENYTLLKNKLPLKGMCREQLEGLKKIFADFGINYGIKTTNLD
jgi:hypothetical protein